MKRYTAAVLVPSLLLQLTACYSYREITLEELKAYKGANDIKIITETDTILINRASSEILKTDWALSDTSILAQEKSSLDSSYKENPINNEKEIKFHKIKSVAINELDSEKTAGLILLAVGIAALVTGSIIGQSIPSF